MLILGLFVLLVVVVASGIARLFPVLPSVLLEESGLPAEALPPRIPDFSWGGVSGYKESASGVARCEAAQG